MSKSLRLLAGNRNSYKLLGIRCFVLKSCRVIHIVNTEKPTDFLMRLNLSQQAVVSFCGRTFYMRIILLYTEKQKRSEALEWAADQLPTLRTSNLTTAWSDGVALCALLEAVCPGACPRWDLLKPQHKVNNCRLGLRLCTKRLEIPMVCRRVKADL